MDIMFIGMQCEKQREKRNNKKSSRRYRHLGYLEGHMYAKTNLPSHFGILLMVMIEMKNQ
jgi:ribosomal protein L25 (general stress protein Ctc)